MKRKLTVGADEVLTRKEAAKLLKISVPTLDRHAKSGILNPVKLGKLVRYKKDSLLIETFKTT